MNKEKKIAIVTDSNSSILPDEAKALGIFLVPMPFLINSEPYFENVNLTQADFYKLLYENATVSTSQPSIGDLSDLWTEILKEYDELVHIPMSSGLSQSCATASSMAKDFEGKVHVVDNRRISVTQKQSVLDTLTLIKEGKTGAQVKEYLEQTSGDSSIYIAVDTMKYLKKGGRITPAAAMIGTILKLTPVLQIHGERLDKYALTRGVNKAKESMKNAVKTDLETVYAKYVKNGEITLAVGHTNNEAEAVKFAKELKTLFPDIPLSDCVPLPLSISCHIGPGALAVAITRIYKN